MGGVRCSWTRQSEVERKLYFIYLTWMHQSLIAIETQTKAETQVLRSDDISITSTKHQLVLYYRTRLLLSRCKQYIYYVAINKNHLLLMSYQFASVWSLAEIFFCCCFWQQHHDSTFFPRVAGANIEFFVLNINLHALVWWMKPVGINTFA